MARRNAFPAAALGLWTILSCLLGLRAEVGPPREESLYLWIDAHQARVLIGFEEDILIVSEGKMAPFTHDFRKAQQRMPAIPVNIHSMNFTWQAAGQAEYFYEFLSLRSLDKGIMADPTVNVPLLGTVPHKASDGSAHSHKMVAPSPLTPQLPRAAHGSGNQPRLALPAVSAAELNAQEGAEMEGFVMRGVSVSALMDSMALTVRKRPNAQRFVQEWAFLPLAAATAFIPARATFMPLLRPEAAFPPSHTAQRPGAAGEANAHNPVEMEVNALVKANVSAPKVTKETSVQSLSASLAVGHTEPAMSPTNASVRKAGMEDTAIKVSEMASFTSVSWLQRLKDSS
ncbi:Wnt inhibitory factor 1 [Myotis davidii]|uniref:Wnt inhibitory factor 1 n=1 Tax=Myotis davidii TaxID=225400 RepID=L5LIA9_MYODS|nr:Wnt inhibitory factor 1 [Myotis davidii]